MHISTANYIKHFRSFHSKRSIYPNHFLLRLQIEGNSQSIINNQQYSIRPGDLLLVKPTDSYELHIPIDEHSPAPSADYYLCIDTDQSEWLESWWSSYEQISLVHIGIDEIVLSYWKILIYEKRRIKDADSELLDYLARSLLLHIKRIVTNGEFNLSHASERSERSIASRIKLYIESHATDPITLDDISRSVSLSVSRASQLFRETYGQSIIDYAIEVRLSTAQERILFSGSTLQDIAYQCGFANYTHFNRLFRSRFQMSPSTYKKLFSPS